MADEVEIAKNALDVLSESTELISAFAAVSKVLQIAPLFYSVVPFVGAVLGLIQSTLPDTKHEEILGRFEQLKSKIDHVRADIKDLEKTIGWGDAKLQYGAAASRIESGMRFSLQIGKAKSEYSKMRYQKRLTGLCANQQCTQDIDFLLDGMIGNRVLRNSILDAFYEKTKGHRPKISALAADLLQLVNGGLLVIASYEATLHGKEDAIEMIKSYEERLLKVNSKIQSLLDRCVSNFEEHMLSDLNYILDKNDLSNEARLHELSTLMKDKYDWQEHFCLVYDDLWGHENHWFNGYRVESLHRNGKCGIVFYRDANAPAWFSDRYDEAHEIVSQRDCDDLVYGYFFGLFHPPPPRSCLDAKDFYNIITTKLAERGIYWTGCVVVKRSANVCFGGDFSTRIVETVGTDKRAILLLQ